MRALTLLAPKRAVAWAAARATLAAMRQYDAAKRTHRNKSWIASAGSAADATANDLPMLRARARDLVRNNPYAARALDVIVAHQVGYGMMPRPRTGVERLDRRVQTLWDAWAARCDASGRLDFNAVLALVARGRAEAGEALIRLRNGSDNRVPLCLELLEPEQLDSARYDERLPDGGRILQGVEHGPDGRVRAYWLLEAHPNDMRSISTASKRVDAADVLHVFRRLRAGQVRGVPDLAPAMTRLRDLDDYQIAELERAKVQACFAAFVTSPGSAIAPLAGIADAETGERRKTLGPGIIERLMPGEDVKFGSPAGNDGYAAHVRTVLHAVAVGSGVTYHQLTGDLADANYSSLRAGNIEFRRLTEQVQWLVLVPQFCQPVWDAFIAAAVLAGELPQRQAGYPVEWEPPAFEAVDPLKDAQAVRERLSLMLTSPQKAIAEQGYDPATIVDEWKAWQDKLAAAGVSMPVGAAPAPAEPSPVQP